jgi:subtilase family serine protease
MRRGRTVAIALAIALLAGTGPARASTGARAKLPDAHPPWARPANLAAHLRPSSRVDFAVLLGWRDPSEVDALAASVSDPSSPDYERFLTSAQFRARFAPASGDVRSVSAWLRGSGLVVDGAPAGGLWVSAHGTAANVEAALGARVNTYRVGGQTMRALDRAPSVPSGLTDVVHGIVGLPDPAVSPTVLGPGFGRAGVASPRRPDKLPPYPPAPRGLKLPCSTFWGDKVDASFPKAYGRRWPDQLCGYTPSQLQHGYGLSQPISSGTDGAGQTVAVVGGYVPPSIAEDLATFSSLHGLPAPKLSFDNAPRNHHRLWAQYGWWVETMLDVESVHSIAPGAHLLYAGASTATLWNLLDRVEAVVDAGHASIVSDSWGYPDSFFGPAMRGAYEAVLKQAAVTGVGIDFSTGDCADEKHQSFSCAGVRTTNFPASDPWVTSVGGTSLGIAADDSRVFELGWNTWFSFLDKGAWDPKPPGYFESGGGGGISVFYREPAYQRGVVPDHLASRYGKAHRVVPDVSAVGDPYTGLAIGETFSFKNGPRYAQVAVGGTSLSCPLFSGMMALANQAAGHAHGFANPALYAAASRGAFNDILAPREPTAVVDYAGKHFQTLETLGGHDSLRARTGYDDQTGLGTPKGRAFLNAMG